MYFSANGGTVQDTDCSVTLFGGNLCSVTGLGHVHLCEIMDNKSSTSSFADRKVPSILG